MKTVTVQQSSNAFNRSEDTRMHRLWNPETRQFLHMSTKGETPNVEHSWLGFAHQAHTLRVLAEVRKEPWPYIRRSRNTGAADTTPVNEIDF